MAEISASVVAKLRKMSGQGMMDCKKALQQADGDIDKAMEVLRKKGLTTLTKRAERETSEGVVVSAEGDNWASLATLCCETDFVAKSADFMATVDAMKKYIAECKTDSGVDAVGETEINGKKFSDLVTETVSKTGEKMVVGDYARFYLSGPGLFGTYIHFNGKVGAMVEIETSDGITGTDVMKQLAADMAMHVTAVKPLALNKEEIDAETIERERNIYAEQVKNKPANIVDKIVDGKMKKFFAENCLLEQQFVKDSSKTVADVVAEAAKKAGGEAKIKRFARFEVG